MTALRPDDPTQLVLRTGLHDDTARKAARQTRRRALPRHRIRRARVS
ncbi:hypothetical protein ACL02R_10165 [Streptomyces sp. MS19]